MNRSFVIITAALIGLASCGSDTNKKTESEKDTKIEVAPNAATIAATKDSTKWIDDFRAFRDAVYQNNKAKVKEFMDFPLISPGNEVWYIAYDGDEKKIDALPKSSKPFTSKDFDKYYDKLFTKTFIKCLLKIKSEELYKKGEMYSPELKEGETTHQLIANFREEDKSLDLNLLTQGVMRYEDGTTDGTEGSTIFRFNVKNGKIKLKNVFIAG